jgi:hypothetical protein
MQCGAQRRDGEECRSRPMANGRCRMHGGKSPGGVGSATLKTGRYSKYLPTRLAARYHEAQADDCLLQLHEEIALTDARLADVLKRVDTGDSGALWTRLHEAFNDFVDEQDPRSLATLGRLIEAGMADWHAWDEVGKLISQRQRLVESERKRHVEMQQMVTATQMMTLLAAVVDTVRRHVRDRDALAAISADIGGLVARNALPAPGTEAEH